MSPDEREAVKNYASEWKDEHAVQNTIIRASVQAATANIYNEVSRVLEPIVSMMNQSRVRDHFNAIEAAHPGYAAIVPEVQAWVASQPAVVQNALNGVLTGGTAQQVIELLGLFKQQKSAAPAAPTAPAAHAAPAPAAPVVTPPKVVDPKVAAAAAATAPVASTRAVKPGGDDITDYEAAFNEADSQTS